MTLPIALLVASGVGAAVSAAGAIQQGNAQAAAAAHQVQVDNVNETIANQDRAQAIQTADIAQSDKTRQDSQRLAALRADIGSSGLELAGSPLDALTASSNNMALDERRVGYQGELNARSEDITAQNDSNASASAQMTEDSANSSKYLSAGASLLSGAGKAGANYYEATN